MKLKTRIRATYLVVFSLAAAAGLGLPAQTPGSASEHAEMASQDSTNELTVPVGKSVLLEIAKPIARISVSSAEIAEAHAISRSEIMVNGKVPGDTSLIVWEVGGSRQFYNVSVRPSRTSSNERLSSLRRQLTLELPDQKINVSTENDLIFLRGTVRDLTSSERVVQIASSLGKVVNLLYVDVPPPPTQILLKVRFASVDRTLTKNLCWNLFSTGATNTVGSLSTQACSTPTITNPNGIVNTTISNALQIFMFRPDLNLGATIQALQSQLMLEVLAEPNVLAENGKEASFLAGGEYPYPVLQAGTGGGSSGITISYKEFGVRLNFIPTVTPRGTIRLQVAPEVSSLDFANGLTVSGFTVPSLSVRRVRTEVELQDGQSFAIGGLMDNRETQTLSRVPYLSNIPILGKLFQSISRTKQNTELLVIVTPELVGPIPAGLPLPQLKYPEPFLPLNSAIPMSNPGSSVTSFKPPPPPSPTMPIEKLIESLQPEDPLIIESSTATSGTFGGGASQPSPSATPVAVSPSAPH